MLAGFHMARSDGRVIALALVFRHGSAGTKGDPFSDSPIILCLFVYKKSPPMNGFLCTGHFYFEEIIGHLILGLCEVRGRNYEKNIRGKKGSSSWSVFPKVNSFRLQHAEFYVDSHWMTT